MNDERELLEIDSRLRASLQPSGEACRRVVALALTGPPVPKRRRRRIGLAAATAGAVSALLILAGLQWRHGAARPRSPSLSVTSAGPLLIVESENGRRWILNHPLGRSGNYVIVVSE